MEDRHSARSRPSHGVARRTDIQNAVSVGVERKRLPVQVRRSRPENRILLHRQLGCISAVPVNVVKIIREKHNPMPGFPEITGSSQSASPVGNVQVSFVKHGRVGDVLNARKDRARSQGIVAKDNRRIRRIIDALLSKVPRCAVVGRRA